MWAPIADGGESQGGVDCSARAARHYTIAPHGRSEEVGHHRMVPTRHGRRRRCGRSGDGAIGFSHGPPHPALVPEGWKPADRDWPLHEVQRAPSTAPAAEAPRRASSPPLRGRGEGGVLTRTVRPLRGMGRDPSPADTAQVPSGRPVDGSPSAEVGRWPTTDGPCEPSPGGRLLYALGRLTAGRFARAVGRSVPIRPRTLAAMNVRWSA